MASEYIRCDEQGVPRLVQHWYLNSDNSFCITLWNGTFICLDRWTVRNYSLKGVFHRWTPELDGYAVDLYIRDFREYFIKGLYGKSNAS